ncbi:uncharacterized protein LOC114286459 [Camellia sinensis]|uniref:uncharacterized protein LOC114286459 n=1 Tax=Camellia sinensis TaxID=4442 RepID=UPI001036166C|nr:uncharacterized protein LOC114286459 [Camellia sinensis]
MTSSTAYLFTDFSAFSSSSSSDDENADAKIVSLVDLYEINNASMIQILIGSDQLKKKGGFVVRHKYICREKRKENDQLVADYFATTSTIRMLAYEVVVDAIDDYVQIGESTTIKSLKHFCNSIIEIFGPEYLRSPSPIDVARLLAIGEVHGCGLAFFRTPAFRKSCHFEVDGNINVCIVMFCKPQNIELA